MPTFTIVSLAYVHSQVDAATAEEAARRWKAWRDRNAEIAVGDGASVLQVFDKPPEVIDEQNRIVGYVEMRCDFRPVGARKRRRSSREKWNWPIAQTPSETDLVTPTETPVPDRDFQR